MSHRKRTASLSNRRLATTLDLARALEHESIDTRNGPPPFLHGLPHVGEIYQPEHPINRTLKKIIEENYYTDNFEAAIEAVSKERIPELSRIRTLDQFYFYLDALVTWLPEIRHWSFDGKILHERTVYLRLCQFYYYFNQPQLEALQSPIAPIEGSELSPISQWMHEFAIAWGAHLDTPASTRYLESFKYAPEFAWQDYEKPPEDYDTFNAFFARTFSDIEVQRPVAGRTDDRVVVFPAESTFVGQWEIGTPVGEPMPAPPSIVVKHIEWSIAELLQDTKYADTFEGGLFCHSFLNTYDYHRLHSSVAGEILEAKFIPGQVYLEVGLAEMVDDNGDLAHAVVPRRHLDADDATGYQFVQCRGLLVVESAIGKVAVLPIGMAQVSSVVFVTPGSHEPILLTPEEKAGRDYNQQVALLNEKIEREMVGKHIDKGEMFSCFQFGGSDIVIVFERKSNVDITAKVDQHYRIRTQLGIANIDH